MKQKVLIVCAAAALVLGSCNDLTDPLPSIAGTYTYQSRSSDFVRLNRNGTITIDDFNRRSANFTGTFDFTNNAGEHVRRLRVFCCSYCLRSPESARARHRK